MPDSELKEALQAFIRDPNTVAEPIDLAMIDLPKISAVNLPNPVDHIAANRNFNAYLTAQQANPSASVFVYPQHLHPRFDALLYPRIEKDLLKRLIPLIPDQSLGSSTDEDTTAENDKPSLFLAPIDEERLVIQLLLLSKLLQSTSASDRVGICISACSKRAIPTLGWLQKLAASEQTPIPICLMRAENLEEQVHESLLDALSDYPVLRSGALIDAQYRMAVQFLASDNANCLAPMLIDPPAELLEIAHSKGWPCFSAEHWDSFGESLTDLPTPLDLYQGERMRARGVMLCEPGLGDAIAEQIELLQHTSHTVQTVINGVMHTSEIKVDICACQDVNVVIGTRMVPTEEQVREALSSVEKAQLGWDLVSVEKRSKRLADFAELVSEKHIELATLLAYETGKPIKHALSEVRDAIDLAYYYTRCAPSQLANVELFEDQFSQHQLELHGRGVFVAIPSNETPIAELIGGGIAALISGNGLVVKPSENASMTSLRVFELMLQAMIPKELIAFLPGGLREIGDWLLEDYRVGGVIYTGLGAKGSQISAQLANRPGAQLIPILVNSEGHSLVMIDSDQDINTRLPRLLRESFTASSQYPLCSYVFYIEESVAAEYEQTIINALPLINVGAPLSLQTDLGPVSSTYRLNALYGQIERMRSKGRILAEQAILPEHEDGLFVPPTLIRLYTLDELQEVIPGPLLYIIRFSREDIERVVNEINRTGYGLSLSLFSDSPILQHKIKQHVRVGNLNFNHPEPRASAGALPIGGTGPSGTGPQVGGPHYLRHFTCERTVVTKR